MREVVEWLWEGLWKADLKCKLHVDCLFIHGSGYACTGLPFCLHWLSGIYPVT